MSSPLPPRWAEGMLRSLLAPGDRETFSGDLLETYRDSVLPSRGPVRADLWYLGQVAGFAWRQQLAWAFVLSVLFVGRTALDWLAPATDFASRAATSSYLTGGVLLVVGASASWRARTIAAGIVGSAAAAVLAAAFSVAGVLALLFVARGDDTMAAISRSGGLAEAFVLPLALILPGSVIGTAGALLARLARGWRMGPGEDSHARLGTA